MQNKRYAFLIGLFLPIFAWPAVNQNGDFQIWQRNFLIKHCAPQWSFWVVSELRWGSNASQFYHAILHGQLYYAPAPWIVLGPGYEQVWTKETTLISWEKEFIPLFDAIFRARFHTWEIQDRSRLEYVIIDSNPFHWLYRNRFRIIAPPMRQNPKVAFFTDNEFFWFEAHGVNEDRLSAGLMIQWQDNWGAESFYMARFLKQLDGWSYNTVAAFSLLFSF